MNEATNAQTATLIDGKAIAASLRGEITRKVAGIKASHGITPGLAVVLVGENPASHVYVRNKAKQTREAGMNSYEHRLEAGTSGKDLLKLVSDLNQDANVHGILVQLPLPDQINADAVLTAIDPAKDVDGFHVINAGMLATGQDGMVPCTPLGCLMLLKYHLDDLTGLNAVVVGRSNIVGKPMAQLLLREHCTVTIAHSRTKDLPGVCRGADILVAAVGRPRMIGGDWIRPGATVIDVGINRIDSGEGKTRLVGDVDFETAKNHAGAITPVPGGVGPMTIACLLLNTVTAACKQNRVDVPS
jgi:methylenetetrahydrofolate dehydrogenase (NADP+)/methenyltetrahydrofolate cyclohydrolase